MLPFCALIPGIGAPLCQRFTFSLPVVLFFFLRYVIELPRLHFGGELHCVSADLKRSRRVSPVKLRAAFMYVNFVHTRTFSHYH